MQWGCSWRWVGGCSINHGGLWGEGWRSLFYLKNHITEYKRQQQHQPLAPPPYCIRLQEEREGGAPTGVIHEHGPWRNPWLLIGWLLMPIYDHKFRAPILTSCLRCASDRDPISFTLQAQSANSRGRPWKQVCWSLAVAGEWK